MSLKQAVKHLLVHCLDIPLKPQFVVVKHPKQDTYGVALVVDGWYSSESNASWAIPAWQRNLADTLQALKEE